MRLSGLASGMDTESMIKELMKAERVKVDKVSQQKQVTEWKQTAYNELNKDLANFILKSKEDLGLMSKNSMGATYNSSYKNATWVKKITSSDESKLKATATSDSMNGVHTIKMKALAKGVSGISSNKVTTGASKDSISEQFNGLSGSDTMTFTIGGSKDKKVTFIIGKGDERTEAQKEQDSNNNIVRINKNLSEVSLQDIVSTINNATVNIKNGETTSTEPLGIQAGYDSGLDKFFIKTKGNGSDTALSIAHAGSAQGGILDVNDKGGKFLEALGLQVDNDPMLDGVVFSGTDALVSSYKVDGMEFVTQGEPIKYPSNNFTINGVNFSAESLEIDKESSVTISSNTDEMLNKIKGFVEGYNKIVDQMNSVVGQKQYKGFKPLTAEQKEAMSDKEVELWESKAKSGLLKGDDILSRNLQSMRTGLYGNVEGVTGSYNHITNLGISTEKYASGAMGGKLIINEVELRKQIENDASGVMELLFKQPTGELNKDDGDLSRSQISEKRSQSGIVSRIYDNLTAGMKEIVDKSGLGTEADILRKVRSKITADFVIGGSRSMIDNQITQFNKRMDTLNQYLSNKETSYYRRFTAMEQAMQKASSQSGWLSQQMGGGQ